MARRELRGAGIAEYLLNELTDDQVMDALRRPTLKQPVGDLGVPYEFYRFEFAEGCIEQMVSEIGRSDNKLPALQIVCTRLYNRVRRRLPPWIIATTDLEEIGGAAGAIESFVNEEISNCGERQGIRLDDREDEVELWKEVLCDLARPQPDGTVTTELRAEADLKKSLERSRLDFKRTIGELTDDEIRLMRRVTVVNAQTGELVTCYGLGHDVVGLVLRNWKTRSQLERNLRQVGRTGDTSLPGTDLPEHDGVFPGEELKKPPPGIALCLSGGGYRAMIFQLGVLWRLNEVGLLSNVRRISSVSTASITAGMLGLKWNKLTFQQGTATNLFEEVVVPVMKLADHTLDLSSIAKSILSPFKSIGEVIAEQYRNHLFGNATLQDLPADDQGPRFVISATNMQTRVLWRFSRPFMGDYRVGLIRNPRLDLALAVAASSASPPLLSPVRLKLQEQDFDLTTTGDLFRPPYNTNVMLMDGSVYDNLALETSWKAYESIFVSDAGGTMRDEPYTPTSWIKQSTLVFNLLYRQIASLRRRWTIGSFQVGVRRGAYWGITSDIASYQLPDALPCPMDRTWELASTAVRLSAIDEVLKQRLVNWGYGICDAGMHKHIDPRIARPSNFPFPAVGV
jgi:NTE family protein